MDGYHSEPFQERRHEYSVLVGYLIVKAVYHPHETRLHIVAVGIRKETRQIPLDDPCRFGITVAHLADVFYYLVNGCLRTHTLAVVEGSRVQRPFYPGFQNVAKDVVNHTTGELGGEYLAPLRNGGKEGVVVEDAECPCIELAHQANKQRWPVHLEGHRITPVTLIFPCGKHYTEQQHEEQNFSH